MDEASGPTQPPVAVGDLRIAATVEAIAATRRLIARFQATETMLLAAAYDLGLEQIGESDRSGDPDRDISLRSLAAQIGAASRTPDRSVGIRMAEAATVRDTFPATLAAQSAGRISAQHLRVIVEAGSRIDDPAARAGYEDEVLAVAGRETPGRTRPVARRLAERHAPRSLTERHEEARRCRHVRVDDVEDGMSVLTALLPATLAHAAIERITTMATTVRGGAEPSDTRSLGEVRADVLADLLLTGHPDVLASATSSASADAIRAQVQVIVPVATLLGGDTPGELVGGTIIDAHTARLLAGTACGWDRIFVHSGSGAVLAVDRYRPSEEQRRILAARDEHCRFPGCRMPVHRCDVDHTVAAAHGGCTDVCNLANLCRRHHTIKHHSAWRVRQLADGTLRWTTPTGREYDDRPARTLAFITTTDPPPF